MAQKNSSKELSVRQEDYLAKIYNGKRSASSGGAKKDRGDVRCAKVLIEAKMTKKKPPRWVTKDFTKITYEAYSEGREPVLALRFYDPGHVLADPEGWIDLVVRRADEDAMREAKHEKD